MVFTSKDDYLTKTQIQYLEAELVSLIKEAHRVKLDNNQIPTKPNISEVDEAEVSQFLEAIKVILSSLGYDLLEPRTISNPDLGTNIVYELNNKGATGRMAISDNKYVVLKGSTAVLENRPSVPDAIVKLRNDLVEVGIMVNKGDGFYTFTQDAAFNSPSYAASAIVGGAANGRKLWKYGSKTLKTMEQDEGNVQIDD